MTKEECMEALSKHANIRPLITSTGSFRFISRDMHGLLSFFLFFFFFGILKYLFASVEGAGEGEQGVLRSV